MCFWCCLMSSIIFHVLRDNFLEFSWHPLKFSWCWSTFLECFFAMFKAFQNIFEVANVSWCLLDVPWHLFDATLRENPDVSNAFPMLHDTLVISPVLPDALQHLPNTVQYPCFLLTFVWHFPHHLKKNLKVLGSFFYAAWHLVLSSWCCPMSPSVSLTLFNTHVMP